VSDKPDLEQQKHVARPEALNVNLPPDTDQLRNRVAELEALNRQLLDDRGRSEELADKSRERMELLVQASRMLASSLDYQSTLQNIADLCVLKLADWCTVEIADPTADEAWRNRPQQAALAHKDPAMVRWAEQISKELQARYPYDPAAPTGIPNVLRTSKPEIYPVLTDEMLTAMVEDEYLRKIMLQVGYRSVMIVPITIRDRILGVIQFISTRDGQHYGAADLALAEELARQAGIAIDNSRLYQAARQAVQLRDEFLSIAAHELKTPITSLKGHSELIMRRMDKGQVEQERLRRSLQTINRQADRLSYLVAQLLDISRLEAGRMELVLTPVNLREIVEELVANIKITLADSENSGKAYEFEIVQPNSEPVIAEIDVPRIEQVLTNLLNNAIKYSPNGGKITLTLVYDYPEIEAEQGRMVRLSVQDNGIGVAPENREQLFQRFYQVRYGTYNSGMGLGLYISQQIAHLHGGRITAEFPPNGGSVFSLIIPAKQV
jgi:signal transduction histidine kinase